jgi:hypothetical protein
LAKYPPYSKRSIPRKGKEFQFYSLKWKRNIDYQLEATRFSKTWQLLTSGSNILLGTSECPQIGNWSVHEFMDTYPKDWRFLLIIGEIILPTWQPPKGFHLDPYIDFGP